MDGWTETWRGIVAPWECDLTEHFTIAYYFDRLADAASAIGASLGLTEAARSAKRRMDVRFVRELRAGASFHILSAPIALDEDQVRLGHQIVDSADGAITAWVEETLAIPTAQLPRDVRGALDERLLPWPGPAVEPRPAPSTTQGFIITVRDRVKPPDFDPDGDFSLAAFVHRFTAACVQGLAAIGFTAAYLHAERRGYSTFELALRVARLPRSGNRVLVETGIAHLGNSSIRFLHRMIDPTEGGELASLSQFGVQLDLDTRRPAPLPEPLRAAAARLVIPVG
jgi:acyl-CoA thioesterase FadM